MLRVLVVDDEPAARARLKRLLSAFPQVEDCGEAEDGLSAIEKVRAVRPDAVFLDIEMPGCTGLKVAMSLPQDHPIIVFCTAYDSYAVEAFNVSAADYLLKPVQRHRLAESLRRLTGPRPVWNLPEPRQFLVRDGEKFVAVAARDTLGFLSEGGLTWLQSGNRRFSLDVTLNELELRL